MRLFLVIVAFTLFQGYEQTPDGSNFSTQFRVHPEIFGLRQMSNDQVDSIKSDRINSFQDDQIPLRPQETPTSGRPTHNMYQPLPNQQQFENAHSRIISPDTVQDYAEFQRGQGYQAQREFQPPQTPDSYNAANRNYGSSLVQAPRNYQPQQSPQEIPQNYQISEPGRVSVSLPGGRSEYMPTQPDYSVYNEIPRSEAPHQTGYHPQMMPPNYQVINDDRQEYVQSPYQGGQQNQPNYHQDGRQDYIPSTWAGPQQNPQNYQFVNKNSEPGIITISLPGNDETAQGGYNTQRQLPQFINGYQVINEGPVEYMVSGMAPGSTITAQNPHQSPPQSPIHYSSALNANPQEGYMPAQNAYYPPLTTPDLSSGQYFRQSQNDVYTPYTPQDQQSELPYDMWKPQQAPMPITMQMPLPYLDGSKVSQDKLMDMINSQIAAQTGRTARR